MNGPTRAVVDAAWLRECVHCGLCLDACPTYVELGTEMDSPRGRIHLVGALQSGALPLEAELVRHLDLCLGCRACETACPSGVRYGHILEGARAYVEQNYRRPWPQRLRRRLILSIFPRPKLLRALLWPVGALRRVGLWSLVERLVPAARLLPENTPALAPPAAAAPLPATAKRVGLLDGCVAAVLFPETNAATLRVLARSGVAVSVPAGQGCCGALHLHSGDPETARRLARRNIDAFGEDLEAIAVTAAGCGAAMKDYGALLAGDPLYAARANAFAAKVRDATELVAALAPPHPAAPLATRVVYQDACHLAHGQGVREAPRHLLRDLAGVELLPLAEADLCCGSAGSYNLTEPQMATTLGERKAAHIAQSGAECVAVANPGCALQIRAALRARGVAMRVAHPIELLDEAYRR